MSNPMIRIHDVENHKIIDREMTTEEFAEYELDQLEAAKVREKHQADQAAKSALLAKLGITADEAALLLG